MIKKDCSKRTQRYTNTDPFLDVGRCPVVVLYIHNSKMPWEMGGKIKISEDDVTTDISNWITQKAY